MCRYIERAENMARMVNVNWHLTLDHDAPDAQWEPLISITADQEYFKDRYGVANEANVMQFLAFDDEYLNSIHSCLRMARENARSIREIIPADLWEQVNTFYQQVADASNNRAVQLSPHGFFEMVIKESNEFIGRTLTTMTQDDGWHFCRAGRMLERADKTSRILDVKYFYLLPSLEDIGTPLDQVQWSALLRSVSALQSYRQKYGLIVPKNVIDLLMLDPQFPRSIRYCVEGLSRSINRMTGGTSGMLNNDAQRYCEQLKTHLAVARIDQIMDSGLHEFVDELQQHFNNVGQAIAETFFGWVPPVEEESLSLEPTQSQTQS